MPKLLVLYYSTYGHVETKANAVAEGAHSVPGVEVTLKRVPETMPPDLAKQHGVKLDQAAPADPKELGDYDAIIFGTPTRFGNMAAQMRNFLDQTGGLWVKGVLVDKVGSVFTSTGTGGGNESTIISFVTTLMHHGMIYVGLPGTRRHQRGQRRLAVGRGHHRRGRRLASAQRQGTGSSTFPRQTRRHHHGQATRLNPISKQSAINNIENL